MRGKGIIVNINSLAGKNFNDKEAIYCASKWGMRGFMGSFKYAARKENVGVLDVYLGAMRTGMMASRENQDDLLNPADVAEAIYKFCFDFPNMRINEVEIGRANA